MPILYSAATVLLTLTLFIIGSIPTIGQALSGFMHWTAHVGTYALIAFTCGLGWRKAKAIYVLMIVSAIGIIHELTEIITHSHGFELKDAFVNCIGSLVGVVIVNEFRKFDSKEKSPG